MNSKFLAKFDNQKYFLLVMFFLILSFTLIGCSSTQEENLQSTIQVLEINSTNAALQSTNASLQTANAALQANVLTPPTIPPPIEQPTLVPTPEPVAEVADVQEVEPAVSSLGDTNFESWMQTAKILLYEDIVGVPMMRRYVKETLDNMGLEYDNVGSAKGWLKTRLIYGAEGGAPWDLIILAVEYRSMLSGEYFEYLSKNLDDGSSVVLEAWHLDKIAHGQIKPILDECGVEIRNYTGGSRSTLDLLIYPLISHEVLTEPNNYVILMEPQYFWQPDDLGDLMELTGEGDAQLLLGRKIDQKDRLGVLAVCMGGQLTLQTYSSHNYFLDAMLQAWENYIYNALKVRYAGHR